MNTVTETKTTTAKVTKPRTIRNLELLTTEGSLVAVWRDKKDQARHYLAATTKSAGWAGFTKRSELEGPMDHADVIDRLIALKKRGEHALADLDALADAEEAATMAEAIEAEVGTEPEQAEPEADTPVAKKYADDPLYRQLLERAQGRTLERNQQLMAELESEMEALRAKIEETTGVADEAAQDEVAKLGFKLHRKVLMMAALEVAVTG